MESILVKIQDTVAKYADVLSKISRVDVEVVDNRLYRVAGTGMFSELVNQDMSAEGYVYRQVLKTGQPSDYLFSRAGTDLSELSSLQ